MKIHEYQAKAILARHAAGVPNAVVNVNDEIANREARDFGDEVVGAARLALPHEPVAELGSEHAVQRGRAVRQQLR